MNESESNLKSYNTAEIVDYYSDFVSAGLFRYEEQLIKKYFIPGGKTLDIGCGAGRVTIPLYNSGYPIIGMDYSEEMIKSARALNSSIDYRMGNILSTNFNSCEFYNIIFSFNGLMLFGTYDDRLKAVKEIHRIIKNDGVFIFTTPYLDNKVMKPYWAEKAETLGIDVNNMSWDQQLELGEEQLKDYDNDFYLHVPFIHEVKRLMDDSDMDMLFGARRLDYSGLEKMEDELDDNYLWVATCRK